MKIIFLHLDLGVGGAERLVVDAATALQSFNHDVHVITTHHDSNHCFQETRDGTLSVETVGDWLPRSIFGRFYALCSYFRMIFAAIYLIFFTDRKPDIVFCDQVSACIPFLRFGKSKIIYYCHFPDQLLTQRQNFLKKVYRFPLDWFEEYTTGLAHVVLVNSNFTGSIFRQAFKRLGNLPIKVLYPSVNFSFFDSPLEGTLEEVKLPNARTVFLSLNRYERKKNIGLAIRALAKLLEAEPDSAHLIIAGGYDNNVRENIDHHSELVNLASELNVSHHVTFLKSPSDKQKQLLLHSCSAIIYTPENEHFGIVPLEAMYMCRPVIAANSGGPVETVEHEGTGFLCDPDPDSFAKAMRHIIKDKSLVQELGQEGRKRVVKHFSFRKFSEELEGIVQEAISPEAKKEK